MSLFDIRNDLTTDQITNALQQFGQVTYDPSGNVWVIVPDNPEEFCERTDFSLMEKKFGMFNVVSHELHRIAKILPEK